MLKNQIMILYVPLTDNLKQFISIVRLCRQYNFEPTTSLGIIGCAVNVSQNEQINEMSKLINKQRYLVIDRLEKPDPGYSGSVRVERIKRNRFEPYEKETNDTKAIKQWIVQHGELQP